MSYNVKDWGVMETKQQSQEDNVRKKGGLESSCGQVSLGYWSGTYEYVE